MASFDELWGDDATTITAPVSVAPVSSASDFDTLWDANPSQQAQPFSWINELLSAKNSAAKAGIGLMDLADKAERNLNPVRIGGPRLFGANANILNAPAQDVGGESVTDQSTRVFRDIGLLGDEKAQTLPGKFIENAARGAVEGSVAGPLGAAGGAILTGIGGTGGGEIAKVFGGNEDVGNAVGSVVANLSPAALSKIGIVREAGELLGPMFSRMFGMTGPTEAAVGRTLSRMSGNLPAVEQKLAVAASKPASTYSKFKTIGEVTNDQGLLRAEDALMNTGTGATAGLRPLADERVATRAANTLKGFSPTESAYATSKNAESVLGKAGEEIRAVESSWWNAIDDKALVNARTPELEQSLAAKLSELTLDGADPLTGRGAGLVKNLDTAINATEEGVTNIAALQRVRTRALKVLRDPNSDAMAKDAASAVESHVREIIDVNADAGMLKKDVADAWKVARSTTAAKYSTLAAPKTGTANVGSRMTEKVALRGQESVDDELIREGLRSPDALAAQLRAAEAGGQNLAPLYKQALLRELDDVTRAGPAGQSRWPELVAQKRQQFEKVFSAEEMKQIDNTLADIESQAQKASTLSTGGSATNPRGEAIQELRRGKGVAGMITNNAMLSAAPATVGAIAGGTFGYNQGNSTADSLLKAGLGGVAGAIAGKSFTNSAQKSSDLFDQLFSNAIKDPAAAISAINKAKPSGFGKAVREGLFGAAKATVAKEAAKGINSLIKPTDLGTLGKTPAQDKEPEQNSKLMDMLVSPANAEEPSAMDKMVSEKPRVRGVSAVEQEIDSDPYYSALYEAESSRNPRATNANSTAKGAFQFIDATAKAVGLKDPFDLAQSYDAVQKLTETHAQKLGTEKPEILYAAHFLGESLLRKVLNNAKLTDEEQRLVDELESKALPRYMEIYNSKIA